METHIQLDRLEESLNQRISELKKNPESITQYREIVETALTDGKAYYSINTGFGGLASVRVESDKLTKLQSNLISSHAVGVGPDIPKEISKLILQLKIHSLGYGNSGISLETFNQLIALLDNDLIPVIPEKGSLGASGDLAPLAHLAQPLIGDGFVWDKKGQTKKKASPQLKKAGISPIELQPKDGLALINGTQFMAAYGACVLGRVRKLLKICDIVAAMSLSAIRASAKPFDERVQSLRKHSGQSISASNFRKLFHDSEIIHSHDDCGRVQDPYSFRCAAVVHGASRIALEHATSVLEVELNSVTDNPLVFEDGSIVSAGNFHGQPLALAFDYAAMALAELASISERRTYFLLKGHDNLPLLLIEESGLQSGFMIAQYTAAALVSENKVLAHPACVDTIQTSLGQEDHVSMGSISATKLLNILRNVEQVLCIELLCAAQGIGFRTRLNPGKAVGAAYETVRKYVKQRKQDYPFDKDLASALSLIQNDELIEAVESEIGELL